MDEEEIHLLEELYDYDHYSSSISSANDEKIVKKYIKTQMSLIEKSKAENGRSLRFLIKSIDKLTLGKINREALRL